MGERRGRVGTLIEIFPIRRTKDSPAQSAERTGMKRLLEIIFPIRAP